MTNGGFNGFPSRPVTAGPLGIPVTIAGYMGTSAGSVGSANRAIYSKLLDFGLMSGFIINVGTSSGNICLAVYSGTGTGTSARPAIRKATTGSIACPAGSADAVVSLPVLVEPGDWVYLSADNTTATFTRFGSGSDSDRMKGLSHRQDTAFPAPANATPGNAYGMAFVISGIPV